MPPEEPLESVQPVRPVAGYIGGKRRLAERLVARIAAVPHQIYAEAFVGMGGVFFRRRSRPRSEVINDRNGDVANLFRILQRHYPQFMDTLKFQVTSRREFERLKASDPATLTDLERAGRFLYLQRLAFGGKVAGRNFGVDPLGPAAFNLARVGDRLELVAAKQLLAVVALAAKVGRVKVEQRAWPVVAIYEGRPVELLDHAPLLEDVHERLRATEEDQWPVHPLDQRRAGDPTSLWRLRHGRGQPALQRFRRQGSASQGTDHLELRAVKGRSRTAVFSAGRERPLSLSRSTGPKNRPFAL